jgi:hypothetical protein
MESTKYIGMDVHKNAIAVAVMNSAGKVVMESILGSLSAVEEKGLRTLRELSLSYVTITKDLTRVMNRLKALYHSWGIACGGTQVYAPGHRAGWLSKIKEAGVRRRERSSHTTSSTGCRPYARQRIAVAASFQILRSHGKKTGDDCRRLVPIMLLGPQLLASLPCQPVEARPAVVLRSTPLRGDGALLLQLQQNWVESALVHGKQFSADLLDTTGDPVAVHRPEHIQSFEHHQCQGALENILFFLLVIHWVSNKRR